jgi:hypothetical protein
MFIDVIEYVEIFVIDTIIETEFIKNILIVTQVCLAIHQ